MAKDDSAAVLVARFLRTNGYEETLDAFLTEAGLPIDAGSDSKGALTIEQILQEKKVFDVSLAFEKHGLEDEDTAWAVPAPSTPELVETISGNSNILHVAVESVVNHGERDDPRTVIFATAADKTSNVLSTEPPYKLLPFRTPFSDAPILSSVVIQDRYLLTTSMSGRLVLSDLQSGKSLDERRDHQKYVVKIVSFTDGSGTWIATAAWDSKVFLYRILHDGTGLGESTIGEPIAILDLPTVPECILFVQHPEIATPVVLLSRRDSTFLYYYTILDGPAGQAHKGTTLSLLGKQNLAPHSNAWIAFSASAFALSPRDPSILAVATSAVPHMKLIIVRLLLPPPVPLPASPGSATTQAAQARTELALQDREAAAILVHCSTLSPQTNYSTPQLAWRPSGSGVWVNGDDGVIRGIEATTGKIVATLKDGHEIGTKIRCLWGGWVESGGRKEEWVVSGGFDRRLIIWRPTGTEHA